MNFLMVLLMGVLVSNVLATRREVTNILNLKHAIVDSTDVKKSLFNGANEVAMGMEFDHSESTANISRMSMSMRRSRTN